MAHEHHGPHDHSDHQGPAAVRARRVGERRRILLALIVTSVVFVAEVAGGFMANSLALLSDAGHMLSDIAAQALSFVALILAARPSDRRRTFGYYRIEILAALANGLALFGLSVWIVYAAVRRLAGAPQEVHTGVVIVIAVVGLVANLVGAWLLHGAESLNLRGAYLHVLQDTLSSVAVVIGGTVMALVPGTSRIDPLLSIAIGLFVNWGAWRLVRDAVDVLLEAVPLEIDLDKVCAALAAQPGVVGVHDLHLWTITSGIFALSAHVVIDGGAGERGDALLTSLREMLHRDYKISHTTIQVETPEHHHLGTACGTEPCL
jgi:cobalt-zinc-cadmium efflux system protein